MGRPKGAVNKTTTLAKDAIAMAAEGLGGTTRIIAWAQEAPENERAFWTQLYTKLIPAQLEHSGSIETQTKEQRDAAVAAAIHADT